MSFADTANLSILLVTAFANLAIGLYVLLGKPRDPVRQSFFLLTFGGFTLIGGLVTLSVTHNFFFDPFTHYGAILLFVGAIRFLTLFPNRISLPVRPALLYAPFAIAAVCIIPQHYIVAGITVLPNGGFVPILGPLLPVWSLILLGYTAFIIGILKYRYSTTTGHVRSQIVYLLFGISVFFGSLVLFGTVLPAAFGITSLNGIGPLSSIVFISLTAYAIVRHQLMDIRIIIQRSLIYSILLGLIIAFYISIMQTLRYALGESDQVVTFAGAIATTVAGIFTAPHIERFFRRATDRIFFKDTYTYADALQTLSSVLHANVEFEDLVRESEATLASLLRTSSVRITLGSPENNESLPHALTVPIELDGEDIGCIYLGEKRSGDAYTPEDIQLLKTFAYQAATALSRAQLYADAQEHASMLETKVSERTKELSDTYERERQMLNDLSHTLQTPLTVLQTKLDTLKPILPSDTEIRSFEQSLAGFSDFIYDLLSLARLEAHGILSEDVRTDLSALMEDLAEEVGVIAAEQDIQVHTDIEPGLFVSASERRLRDVFMNLASNALKYIGDGPERMVSFSAHKENADVVILVADTGRGIDTTDLPHIFDRFYRGMQARSGVKGTGLGLAITKRIVEQHTGSITAQSTPGAGTVMEVRLPLLDQYQQDGGRCR